MEGDATGAHGEGEGLTGGLSEAPHGTVHRSLLELT